MERPAYRRKNRYVYPAHERFQKLSFVAVLAFACLPPMPAASQAVKCPNGVMPKASKPLTQQTRESDCSPKMSHGFKIPDSGCTPGAINPTVTLEVLQGGEFKTTCERDRASTRTKKATTYDQYNIAHPDNNTGQNQVCELDHVISLEIGGADTIDNIWPQCGPDGAVLAKRYFKVKDGVENYLAAKVRAGEITLEDAQHGIATDWTQFVKQARAYWANHSQRGFGKDR